MQHGFLLGTKRIKEICLRKTKGSYCIWVSEVMLQQTQVEYCNPYYNKFIMKFLLFKPGKRLAKRSL